MKKRFQYLVLCIVLFGLAACGGSPPPVTPSPAVPIVPTVTPIPLYMSVTLGSLPFTESGIGPDYNITTNTPVLIGSSDPRIRPFNNQMTLLIQGYIDGFRNNWQHQPPESLFCFLDITFTQMSPPGNLLSLRFTIRSYSNNAPHTDTYSHTVTYNLEAGQFVTLSQLFLPGSNYLGIIFTYCIAKLEAELGSNLWRDGALPTPDNYRNWNITAEGLLITFDRYQVASYPAGPRLITVPYSELQSIIDPQGPLAGYLP
jgi:hypothetical protein